MLLLYSGREAAVYLPLIVSIDTCSTKEGRSLNHIVLRNIIPLFELTVALGQGDDRQGTRMLKESKRIRNILMMLFLFSGFCGAESSF